MSAPSLPPLERSRDTMNKPNKSSVFTGERLTPRAAIRAHCRECNGGSPDTCPVPSCPIFPFRLSEVSPEATTTPLRAIRARCQDCAGGTEAVRDCTACKRFHNMPACALWPHREGKRYVTEEYRDARRSQANKQRREPGTGGTFAPQSAAKE